MTASIYAKHPKRWTKAYRELIRRCITLSMWSQGYGRWAFPDEVNLRVREEEARRKRYVLAEQLERFRKIARAA